MPPEQLTSCLVYWDVDEWDAMLKEREAEFDAAFGPDHDWFAELNGRIRLGGVRRTSARAAQSPAPPAPAVPDSGLAAPSARRSRRPARRS